MPTITVTLDENDFELLAHTSMRWSYPDGRNDWTQQEGRFFLVKHEEDINWQYRHAFWLGTEWTTVLLARAYLDAVGQPYQVLWDMVENPDMSWVIITDHEPAGWPRADARRPDRPTDTAPASTDD